MPRLPENNQLYSALEGYTIEQPLRPYLGYSQIGHECDRYIWYSFRWMYREFISPRKKRLLERGKQEEVVMVAELENAGVTCKNVLEDQCEVTGVFGHAKGHPDGELENVPTAEKTEHLFECKAMADKYFKEIEKFGVKRSQPVYFVQVQMYMGKRNLTRCLFCVTNKDNDKRYYERIHFEKETFERYEDRATQIVMSVDMPKRMTDSPEFYQCKNYPCGAYQICFKGAEVESNCRTCKQSTILEDGQWGCLTYPESGPIPLHIQRAGCPARVPLL